MLVRSKLSSSAPIGTSPQLIFRYVLSAITDVFVHVVMVTSYVSPLKCRYVISPALLWVANAETKNPQIKTAMRRNLTMKSKQLKYVQTAEYTKTTSYFFDCFNMCTQHITSLSKQGVLKNILKP